MEIQGTRQALYNTSLEKTGLFSYMGIEFLIVL